MLTCLSSVESFSANGVLLSRRQDNSLTSGGDLRDVLEDGGAADAEQPGDGGDGVVRLGQQVAGAVGGPEPGSPDQPV